MKKISFRLEDINSSGNPSWLAIRLPVLGILYVILGAILISTATDVFVVTVTGLLGLITILSLFIVYWGE